MLYTYRVNVVCYLLAPYLFELIDIEHILYRINTVCYVLGHDLYTLIDIENVLYHVNLSVMHLDMTCIH